MGCGSSVSATTEEVRRPVREVTAATATAMSPSSMRGPNAMASQPLRPVGRPWKEPRDVSRADMARRRVEFWHTRVSGSRHVWSTLKMACEAMLTGDVETANAIVEAGGIITPSASLALCYDEQGASYEVPLFVYSDPANLTDKLESDKIMKEMQGSGDAAEDATVIAVNFRVAPGEVLYRISLPRSTRVATFKDQIHNMVLDESGGDIDVPQARMRLIWWGRELQNANTLGEAGLLDEQMVQVYLRPVLASA